MQKPRTKEDFLKLSERQLWVRRDYVTGKFVGVKRLSKGTWAQARTHQRTSDKLGSKVLKRAESDKFVEVSE